MEQGSKDWLLWRSKGIGASDSPIIMGKSKYKTRYQLFMDKINPKLDNTTSFVQELGHKFEPKALGYLALKHDILDFKPTLFEHKEFNWLRASLDGYSEEKNIALELKYVGKDRFNYVKESGLPLADHEDQLQHILMVTGASSLIYGVYTLNKDKKELEEIHSITVYPDLDYILKTLFPELKRFWDMVKSGTPPELTDKDTVEASDESSLSLASSYLSLLEQKKQIETKLKETETELKAMAESQNVGKLKIKNLSISRVVRVGAVDYKKIPELKSVDLDQYRKAPTTYFSIRADK